MKSIKIAAILYYIAAVLMGLSALLALLRGHNPGVGIVLLCAGSGMLCFGAVLTQRYRQTRHSETVCEVPFG